MCGCMAVRMSGCMVVLVSRYGCLGVSTTYVLMYRLWMSGCMDGLWV